MILQVAAAFFVTIFFSIMFNNSTKKLFYSGLVGAIGWWAYLLVMNYDGTVVAASFVGSMVISVLATLLSIYKKAPITIFQIPGIIPLVPGMGMYNTLYAVITNNYEKATYYLFETLQIAGAIAVGMMLVYTLRTLLQKKKSNQSQIKAH